MVEKIKNRISELKKQHSDAVRFNEDFRAKFENEKKFLEKLNRQGMQNATEITRIADKIAELELLLEPEKEGK
jgi:predicted  nucleic acid-binding Zn-ribbon protein